MRSRPAGANRLMAEAATAGLAYAMTLWWLSVCALASFRPEFLIFPYWPRLPALRSDTSGAIAFFVTAVCLVTSEYLRLRRRANGSAVSRRAPESAQTLLTIAVAETVAVLATGLVVYISTNSVTHPETLMVGTTHLAPWPTEGTLRILALIGCACSIAALRYLLAGSFIRPTGSRPAVATRDGFGPELPSIDGDGTTVSRISSEADRGPEE
jgi:hypothetical protein